MARTQKYTVQQVVDALQATRGMVYIAAQRLGCTYQTIYNYRDRHPIVARTLIRESGTVNDTAELQLFKAIAEGKEWAIKYRLSNKATDRGYGQSDTGGTDRSEQTLRVIYGDDGTGDSTQKAA